MASGSPEEKATRVLTSSAVPVLERQTRAETCLKSDLRVFRNGLYFCSKRVAAGPRVFSSTVSICRKRKKKYNPVSWQVVDG